jgi:hypothetical protein
MAKDDVLNFRVPADLKAALRKAAHHDERSMSVMAGRILREWLTVHGFYTQEADPKPPRPRR